MTHHTAKTLTLALLCMAPPTLVTAQEQRIDGKTLRALPLETPKNHGGFGVFAFSPDGQKVAGATGIATITGGGETESFGGEVLIWDARRGKIINTLGRHAKAPTTLAFSEDGKTLFSYSNDDQKAMVWKTKGGKPKAVITFGGPGVGKRPPALSPDAKTLVHLVHAERQVGESSLMIAQALEVWDVKTKRLRWSQRADAPQTSRDASFATSPDSRTLCVYVKNTKWAEQKGQARGARGGAFFALLSLDSGETIWRKDFGPRDRSMPEPKGLRFLPDGSELISFHRDALQRWSPETGEAIGEAMNVKSEDSVSGLFFSADGKRALIHRFFGKQLDLYELVSGKHLASVSFAWPNTLDGSRPTADLSRVAGQVGFDPVVLDLSALTKKP